jgi:transposase
MARTIGIRHRVKRTADGEARPTMVAICDDEWSTRVIELEDDDAELDFLLGRFPIEFGAASEVEAAKAIPHHVRRRGEVVKIPSVYDGLKKGDTVLMALGGSGDRFAAALSRRGEEIGAEVFRIPPFSLKNFRGEQLKDDDHQTLIEIWRAHPGHFTRMVRRDRDLVRVREALSARQEAQRARIACEQRLRQQLIGRVFLSEDGKYPEGTIEAAYDAAKASDKIFENLSAIEAKLERELRKTVHATYAWKVFGSVEGCGEVLAAKIIARVGDVRRFATEAKFKAYCGVHLTSSGEFPRRRRGELAKWTDARQAFYLLADQWNRRPESEWGKKLIAWKLHFKEKHPESLSEDGKKRYTKGHIHRMALWRTMTKFAKWLYREWSRVAREADEQQVTAQS